ncbi:MAG: putative transcriptional regulator, MerR family [Sphaerisporangium sp.]|jgi:DNA-binding transcriptional MerR regulator|nr:putative transcriptional regulator, MerR family [Sphaerisporangium sp.]
MSDTWTIGELAERAAGTLRPTSPRPNGRVRDVPNERLIRWYTTIGLLDPPLTRRGRVALYGRRHLLQLIAVKRRQSEGRSIADIQAELAGATDATLEAIARIASPAGLVPGGDPGPEPNADGRTGSGLPPARQRFWTERPAVTPQAVPEHTTASVPGLTPPAVPGLTPPLVPGLAPPAMPGLTPPALTGIVPDAVAPAFGRPTGVRPSPQPEGLLHGVRLAPGVTLLLEGRTPSPDDVAALQEAAATLLDALRDRDLADPGTGPIHPDLDRSPSEGMHP